MTKELDNLLTAAKAIWLGCGETEVGNLHRAITEFEAVRETHVLVPVDVLKFLYGDGPLDGKWFHELQEEHGNKRPYWWRRHLHGPIAYAKSFAPDPYDFENAGLRKEV